MLTRPNCVLLLNTLKSCTRAWKFSGFDICSSSCLTLLTTPISIVLHVDFQTISPKSVSKTLELYKTIFYWIPKVPKKNDTQHIHNEFLYQVSFPIVHYLSFLPPVTFLSKLSLTLPSSPLPHSINFKSWKFSNLVFSKYVHLSLSSSLLFIWFQATSIPLFYNADITTLVANHCSPSATSPFNLFTTVQPVWFDYKAITALPSVFVCVRFNHF